MRSGALICYHRRPISLLVPPKQKTWQRPCFRKKLSRLEHVLFLKVSFASYFRKRLSKENLLVCHYLNDEEREVNSAGHVKSGLFAGVACARSVRRWTSWTSKSSATAAPTSPGFDWSTRVAASRRRTAPPTRIVGSRRRPTAVDTVVHRR